MNIPINYINNQFMPQFQNNNSPGINPSKVKHSKNINMANFKSNFNQNNLNNNIPNNSQHFFPNNNNANNLITNNQISNNININNNIYQSKEVSFNTNSNSFPNQSNSNYKLKPPKIVSSEKNVLNSDPNVSLLFQQKIASIPSKIHKTNLMQKLNGTIKDQDVKKEISLANSNNTIKNACNNVNSITNNLNINNNIPNTISIHNLKERKYSNNNLSPNLNQTPMSQYLNRKNHNKFNLSNSQSKKDENMKSPLSSKNIQLNKGEDLEKSFSSRSSSVESMDINETEYKQDKGNTVVSIMNFQIALSNNQIAKVKINALNNDVSSQIEVFCKESNLDPNLILPLTNLIKRHINYIQTLQSMPIDDSNKEVFDYLCNGCVDDNYLLTDDEEDEFSDVNEN